MHTQRLSALADFLDTVPAENFNIDTWASTKGSRYMRESAVEKLFTETAEHWDARELRVETNVDGALECGTAACAVGWAAINPEFRAQGFTLKREPGASHLQPSYGGRSGWSAVDAFFELSGKDADILFSGSSYIGTVLPSHVAARIRYAVKTDLLSAVPQ